VTFARGQEVIGSIEVPRAGDISREAGEIRGWVLSKSEKIDRVEIVVGGRVLGNAKICLPYSTFCRDLPEAATCGFQWSLPADCIPRNRQAISVGFVAYSLSGKSYVFPPREIALASPAYSTPIASGPTISSVQRAKGGLRKKIRVACFTHDLDYGGSQLFLRELLRQFASDEQADYVIFSPCDGPLRGELSALGFVTDIFEEPARTNISRHDRDTEAISKRLLEGDFDCVLVNSLHSFYAINAAVGAGIPSIWCVHESFLLPVWSALYARGGPGRGFIQARLESAFRRCAAVTFVSEATRRLFLEYGNNERFLKIPYGIDISSIDNFSRGFDRNQARRTLEISPGCRLLLCTARVEQRKHQILLAQAFAEVSTKHPEARLFIVGDSPSYYSSVLRQYLHEARIDEKIRLVPAVHATYPWYAIADGFVLLSDVESMPRSIMEAMGFGLPVLASNVFGVPELIDAGTTGFLAEPNSLRSAVEGLNKLLGLSETKRRSMARAAREKIERDHDSRSYARAYSCLIKKIVSTDRSQLSFPLASLA